MRIPDELKEEDEMEEYITSKLSKRMIKYASDFKKMNDWFEPLDKFLAYVDFFKQWYEKDDK